MKATLEFEEKIMKAILKYISNVRYLQNNISKWKSLYRAIN
jgi:hypothetical protein